MKRAIRVALAGAITGFLLTLIALPVQADPGANEFYKLGNYTFEEYRTPWRERDKWRIDGGCKVSDPEPVCTAHRGINQYAIDLNKQPDPDGDCSAPLRAVRSGATVFFTPAEVGSYGYVLGILHNGEESSWYAHLTADSAPSSEHYGQGDYAAKSSGTGASGSPSDWPCHLHFQVNTGTNPPGASGYQTINVCLSGTCPGPPLPTPGAGFDLQHLSDQNNTEHPSNNTGPGYGRPNTYAWLDPGPEDEPLSTDINTLVRDLVSQGTELGSTFASIQGPCATHRHWVKSCDGLGYTQNFLSPRYAGLYYPRSVTEGPGSAYVVDKALWKAYGLDCGGGGYAYELLGRPTASQGDPISDRQNFEGGYMVRSGSYPVTVWVYVWESVLACTWTGLLDWDNGPCYDVDASGIVLSNDIATVIDNYRIDESNSNHDDRYDMTRDGAIRSEDWEMVVSQYRKSCK